MAGTNITASELANFTGGQFVTEIAGTEIVAGLLLLSILAIWLFKSNAKTGVWIVLIIPIVIVLSTLGFMPDWLYSVIAMGVAVVFVVGLLKQMGLT